MGTERCGTSEVRCKSGTVIKWGREGWRRGGEGGRRGGAALVTASLANGSAHRSWSPRLPFGHRAPPAPRRTCTHLLGAQARAGQQQQRA